MITRAVSLLLALVVAACGSPDDATSGLDPRVPLTRWSASAPHDIIVSLHPNEDILWLRARRLPVGAPVTACIPVTTSSDCAWSAWVRFETRPDSKDIEALLGAWAVYEEIRADASKSPDPIADPLFNLSGDYGSMGYFSASPSNSASTSAAVETFERVTMKYADNSVFRDAGLWDD